MIIFDTETTGFISSTDAPLHTQPKIIEIFSLRVCDRSFDPLEELELLIDPGEQISEEITKITGITNDMVAGQGQFSAHLGNIQGFWRGEELAVGHNITFDLDMVEIELKRLGMVNRFPWTPRRACTVEISEHLEGRRLKLIDLHRLLFGEGFEEAHRAKNDVMATYRCFKELVNRGEFEL